VVARRVASATALALAAVIALLVALASEALAHASLIKAEPADGAVVPTAPAALTLTFNEPVAPLVMRLVDPSGEATTLGAVASENAIVRIAAPAAMASGTHVLSWRVISADGHPVGGSVVFSIGAPSARSAADAASLADGYVRAGLWAAKVVIYAGLLIGVGGAFFRAWIGAGGTRGAGAACLTLIAAALLAVPASVGLQGLDALDLPLATLRQRVVWETGLATSYGLTAIAAALALFAGIFALAAKSLPVARALSLAGLLGVGLAFALSGHASTAAPRFVNAPAVFLHGACVAFWIGSLLPLLAGLRASPEVGEALARFSRVIPLPLVLIVATGVWLAVVQLGRVDALWTTGYGQVLACKVVAVAALLGLGAANRYWLVPRLQAGGAAAARPLVRSISFELALALMILVLVALWRFTPPPRALATDAPISFHIHGDKAMAEIAIERGGGEGARANMLVLDGAFRPLAAKEVTLVLANPAAGIEPLRRSAVHSGESNWRIDDLRVPVAGRWDVRVEILVTDFDKVTVEDSVALPRVP
jgi:copper transport protein